MKLKTKKLVFVGLCLITVGAAVGSVWFPGMAALAGTSLIATGAVGRIIVRDRDNNNRHNEGTQTHEQAEPVNASHSVSPQLSPSLPQISPAMPSHSNLSPPKPHVTPISVPRVLDQSPTPPQLQRDFSMHISYRPEATADGSISPDSLQVRVRTSTPSSPPRPLPAQISPVISASGNPLTPQSGSPNSTQNRLVALASPQSPVSPMSPPNPQSPVAVHRLRQLTAPGRLSRQLTIPEH